MTAGTSEWYGRANGMQSEWYGEQRHGQAKGMDKGMMDKGMIWARE
jgi:hypothetical protein